MSAAPVVIVDAAAVVPVVFEVLVLALDNLLAFLAALVVDAAVFEALVLQQDVLLSLAAAVESHLTHFCHPFQRVERHL